MDNAACHPIYIDNLTDNWKFLFMPPNTTSLIQPMDQGVISTFKSYYLRRTFQQFINAIDDSEKIAQFQNFGKHLTSSWMQLTTFQNRVMRLHPLV